jgi:hypothetical protein
MTQPSRSRQPSRDADPTAPTVHRSMPAAGPDLAPGTRLGGYELVRVLGRGGMGVVYEACDVLIGRSVAIKTLAADLSADREAVARFLAEARAAGRLTHPNVVTIFQVAEQAGMYFLVLEMVTGGSAADLLRRHGPMDWRSAVRVVADACRGLASAHRAGLVHRDIKPGNILFHAETDQPAADRRSGLALDGQGRIVAADSPPAGPVRLSAKLADFGLARTADSSLTTAGSTLGTPAYMSPEQCLGRTADARSDVYALGATLFHLLTGRPPYVGDTLQMMYGHADGPIPDPRAVRPGIPAAAAALIARAMAKDPAGRFPSAEAMLVELERLAAGPGRPAAPPAVIAAAAAALVLLGLAGAWLAIGSGTAPTKSPGPAPAPPTAQVPAPAPPPIWQEELDALVLRARGLEAVGLAARAEAEAAADQLEALAGRIETTDGDRRSGAAADARLAAARLRAAFPEFRAVGKFPHTRPKSDTLSFRRDGMRLVVGGGNAPPPPTRDGRRLGLETWDVSDPARPQRAELRDGLRGLYAADADRLVAVLGGPDGKSFLFGPAADGDAGLARPGAGAHQAAAVSPDGAWGVSSDAEHRLLLHNLQDIAAAPRELAVMPRSTHRAAFSADGRMLAAGTWSWPERLRNDRVRLWAVPEGRELAGPRRGFDHVFALAFSPDGRHLAVGEGVDGRDREDGPKRTLTVWPVGPDGVAGASLVLRAEPPHLNAVFAVVWLDARTLASASYDATVRVWDIPSGRLIGELRIDGAHRYKSAAYHPGRRLLAVGCESDVSDIDLYDVSGFVTRP